VRVGVFDLKLGGANIFIAPVTSGDGVNRRRPRLTRGSIISRWDEEF